MPLIRKRARPTVGEDDNDSPSPPPAQRNQRRRSSDASEVGDVTQANSNATSQQQMVKNLVRLALACEYTRTPLRRADISSKCLGTQPRQFKSVFDSAQLALQQTFGMEMVELPVKEKVTLAQRKQAQKTGASGSASSKSWILRSLLPPRFHVPEILTPPKVPTEEVEAAYVGLYSTVVALISLSGGTLPEAKLDRYLKRMNADQSTPVGETSKMLQRMMKENYIRKEKEAGPGGEDPIFEYWLGPRAKMEIGTEGTAALVRSVYGEQNDDELERRLDRSLKMQVAASLKEGIDEVGGTQRKGRGRGRRENGVTQAGEDESDDND